MFLNATLRRNPELVRAAIRLHRDGDIPPDTYVIDLDTVAANATQLASSAHTHGIELFFVCKHLGRNPAAIATIAEHLPQAAAIDVHEARLLHRCGVRLGNAGHLVQLPERDIDDIVSRRPQAVTVFNLDKARSVTHAAAKHGLRQPLLARLTDDGDSFYPGQEGGIPLAALEEFATEVARLPGAQLAGLTSFPCLLYQPVTAQLEATPNLRTLLHGRHLLEAAGRPVTWINAPSATCVAAMPTLAAWGVTHAEPGHALTGTVPLHAHDMDQPERPALVYVSEVSHLLPNGQPAIFGGGFYSRADIHHTLLTRNPDTDGLLWPVEPAPADNIDYYRLLAEPDGTADAHPGDTAVLAFRTQIFVTRSTVAAVAGLATGHPHLAGLYDPFGRPL